MYLLKVVSFGKKDFFGGQLHDHTLVLLQELAPVCALVETESF